MGAGALHVLDEHIGAIGLEADAVIAVVDNLDIRLVIKQLEKVLVSHVPSFEGLHTLIGKYLHWSVNCGRCR